jgi:hypothetical protein
MKNPRLLNEIEAMRGFASITDYTKVFVGAPTPEDFNLCLEVYKCLRTACGVMPLHRADWRRCGLLTDDERLWNREMLGIADALLVLATDVPSAEAQREMIAALCAGKQVRVILPNEVQLPDELKTIIALLGEVEILRWDRTLEIMRQPISMAAAQTYERPPFEVYHPWHGVSCHRLAA